MGHQQPAHTKVARLAHSDLVVGTRRGAMRLRSLYICTDGEVSHVQGFENQNTVQSPQSLEYRRTFWSASRTTFAVMYCLAEEHTVFFLLRDMEAFHGETCTLE